MKIVVKHDRDDKGWVVMREQQFADAKDKIHKDLYKALVAARAEYPEAELFVDDRIHSKMNNGMVMIIGDTDLMPVEWVKK